MTKVSHSVFGCGMLSLSPNNINGWSLVQKSIVLLCNNIDILQQKFQFDMNRYQEFEIIVIYKN